MAIIGLLAVVASIVFGFKSGGTDFFVLAGLIFVGTCILEVSRMIHRNTLKRMKIITDALNEFIEEFNKNNEKETKEWAEDFLEKIKNNEE